MSLRDGPFWWLDGFFDTSHITPEQRRQWQREERIFKLKLLGVVLGVIAIILLTYIGVFYAGVYYGK